MQFSHRIGTIIVFLFLAIFVYTFFRQNSSIEEEPPEAKILRILAALETQVSEYEAVVQSYRAELIATKEEPLPRQPNSNQYVNSSQTNREGKFMSGLLSSSRLKTVNIYHALPNLLDNEDSLVPALTIGKNRIGVSLVIGVPTVKRPTQSYLLTTLQNLLNGMRAWEKNDSLIIVFIAETDVSFVQSTVNLISKQFKEDVNSGLLEIVSPSPNFYPDLKSIKGSLGDSDERTRWRTKQNLDYAYMMLYAQHRGTFYVQLEDDVLSKKGFVTTMKSFALQKTLEKEDWFMLDFCQLGFIGKMFRSSDLWKLAEFFILFYKDKPGDWLLSHFFSVKYCKLDQNHKKCLSELGKHWIHYKPSLFQHIGMVSSLSGKVQKLKDRQYGKLELFKPHNNPRAKVQSTIMHYGKFSLGKAYEGKNYFWGLSPKAGDTIEFSYEPPIRINRYRIVSGNAEHPSDKLHNCTLEVMPATLPNARQKDFPSGKYVEVDEFDELGTLEGVVSPSLNPVSALRLFLKSSTENWVIISEIYIEKDPDF